MEIHGHLIKHWRPQLEPIICARILPFYFKSLQSKQAPPNEILYACCIFDDFLEFCSTENFNRSLREIIAIFLSICEVPALNNDILQTISYGLGVFAQKAEPALFEPYYMPVARVDEYLFCLFSFVIYKLNNRYWRLF